MTYERLVDVLLKRVPEIRIEYQREARAWKGEKPGQHIVFADVLVPFILTLLRSGKGKALLGRIFALLEDMATHPDEDVRDVVGDSVGEAFWGHDELSVKASRLMGPETSKIIATAWDMRFGAPWPGHGRK